MLSGRGFGASADLDQVEGFTTTGGLTNSSAYLYDGNGNLTNTPSSLYIREECSIARPRPAGAGAAGVAGATG